MMLLDSNDVLVLHLILHVLIVPWITCTSASPTKDTNKTRSAAACYGNVNNYVRLYCPDDQAIKVIKVIHGAKLVTAGCVTPATEHTYDRSCCRPSPSDCKIRVQDTVSSACNGHTQCDVMAMWSTLINQCDQDVFPITSNYMQADYVCVPSLFSVPRETTEKPTTANTTTSSTYRTRTTMKAVVVSTHEQDTDGSGIEMSDAIIGAILAGSIGMLLTFVVFVFYWRRKRKLRIIGKPQPTVWDYLLNQTFTVRGERGYDHFSSCRSSASSDNGETKSPVFRKTLWLPNNISPVDDTQSDVFNDNDTVHNLQFHQVGTPNPYAFLSLGLNNMNSSNSSSNHNSNNNNSNNDESNSNNNPTTSENQDYA